MTEFKSNAMLLTVNMVRFKIQKNETYIVNSNVLLWIYINAKVYDWGIAYCDTLSLDFILIIITLNRFQMLGI